MRLPVHFALKEAINIAFSVKEKIEVRQDDCIKIVEYQEDLYKGSCEVTPSRETQVLLTKDKVLPDNVVINPIPQNYGLITYNGFELIVS